MPGSLDHKSEITSREFIGNNMMIFIAARSENILHPQITIYWHKKESWSCRIKRYNLSNALLGFGKKRDEHLIVGRWSSRSLGTKVSVGMLGITQEECQA